MNNLITYDKIVIEFKMSIVDMREIHVDYISAK